MLAGQELYHLEPLLPFLFVMGFFEIGSLGLFAQVTLEPQSS
jgi:hypothetical protein